MRNRVMGQIQDGELARARATHLHREQLMWERKLRGKKETWQQGGRTARKKFHIAVEWRNGAGNIRRGIFLNWNACVELSPIKTGVRKKGGRYTLS